jgi:phosphodiesterase/alkaline phosphatase D-like protein
MKYLYLWYAFFGVIFMQTITQSQDLLVATEILGRPTDHSITVNAVAAYDADAFVMYGIFPGVYPWRTDTISVPNDSPIEIGIGGLSGDTRYYYRFCYRRSGTTEFTVRNEHTFNTQRARGASFRFTVQADLHLYDKKGSSTLMNIAAANQVQDAGDFMLDLGDTFGDDHTPTVTTAADEMQLHLNMRPYYGAICNSTPLFFCLGNHEGENGYYLLQTPPNNLAVYSTLARQFYIPNPVPDGFYSGDTVAEGNGIGLPENYYAWEWGDALFVVLDVYRYYTASEKPGGWDWTIGETQYRWFKKTLENSTAKYKFVFAHHVLGQTRGGVIWANKFEWGGYEADGTTWGFDTHRPGWGLPLHQLMVANGVTIFFQGHDHLFARETLDGLVYQEVPMPCDSTYTVGMVNSGAYVSDTLENSGHLRVTVSGSGVQVDYVKAVEPYDETPTHPNGEVAFSYAIGTPPTKYSLTVVQSSNGTISPGTTLVDSGWSQRFTFVPSAGYHCDSAYVDGLFVPDSTIGYTFTQVTESHTITAHFSADSPTETPVLIATELLGRPTGSSVTLNVVPGVLCSAFVEYGTASGFYTARTDTVSRQAGSPIEITIDGLAPGTRYYYRLCTLVPGDTAAQLRAEHSFETARPRGQSFVFDVQADPHLGIPTISQRDSSVDTTLYNITLQNELADNPDFLLDLGDTFMNEKYYSASYDLTRQAYFAHRAFYGRIGHSVPLFLINGNHDGELGWTLNGTANNLALWSVRARHLYYPNPVPGGFYSGSTTTDANLMLDTNIANKTRDSWYAFEWGSALFVSLDPFWYTHSKPTSYTTTPDEGWKFTLGQEQYDWFRRILQNSTARFKFVMIHNLTGGNSKDGRGGVEAAPYYEWGGSDITGTEEWTAMRGWMGGPLHDLMAANNVTMLMHGHDHFYCKQILDSIIYQECPQPSNANYNDRPGTAANYGYLSGTLFGNSGHMRFTVTDTAVTVDYVRAYRPQDETPARHNGDVAASYTIRAASKPYPLILGTGWNLLSLPVRPDNRDKSILFPDAVSNAFYYDNRYVSAAALLNGTGYWVKFGGPETLSVTGVPVSGDSVRVVTGWNLIGSTGEEVSVTGIISVPPGITTSNFFGYSGRYLVSDTLKPGCGYWVKADQAGVLLLSPPLRSPGSSAQRRIRIIPSAELPPAPPTTGNRTGLDGTPTEFRLGQNYPNPSNPATIIWYDLPEASRITLTVTNLLGEKVAVIDDAVKDAGVYRVTFNGEGHPSGVYFYTLTASPISATGRNYSQTRKLVLMK